jgi:NAD(P)-dependent dehydrogenase (short-subunit alcohol dehydrogenase family)
VSYDLRDKVVLVTGAAGGFNLLSDRHLAGDRAVSNLIRKPEQDGP